jgi:CBS domain-containing protein
LPVLAREIMTTPVLSITEDQSIKEVIDLLAANKFSGVPVVDSSNTVVGIISDTDIVRYSHQLSVIPFTDLSGWISPYADISDLASLRKGIDLLTTTKVAQVMTKKVLTAGEDTDISEIAKLMSRRKINRVPIVDRDGKLVGIITRADLVNNMAK